MFFSGLLQCIGNAARWPASGLLLGMVAIIATPAIADQPPAVVSLTPDSGSGAAGEFSFVINDADGFEDIKTMVLIVSDGGQGLQNTCAAGWTQTSDPKGLYFVLTDDAAGYHSDGYHAENSQCEMYIDWSTVSGSGNAVWVTFHLRFKTEVFSGPKTILVAAEDQQGLTTGLVTVGQFVVDEMQPYVHARPDSFIYTQPGKTIRIEAPAYPSSRMVWQLFPVGSMPASGLGEIDYRLGIYFPPDTSESFWVQAVQTSEVYQNYLEVFYIHVEPVPVTGVLPTHWMYPVNKEDPNPVFELETGSYSGADDAVHVVFQSEL
jgi:hypothetical protein